ncbi:DUF2917 domain-containing protein [Rhizobacter sp. Root1221]|uniref:DUF2917 domain-containing protein n=1 Tax=Rhizobacter sp. Root1221 TaxID=1736433 RepID=UPI000B08DE16|nr:DUF2917 domain-containing protein [Rhizobacter sp. Root1221]
MSVQLMSKSQQRDALWTLAPGQATRLTVGPGPRQLRVVDGWLWLTTEGTRDLPAEDVWLLPGEPMELPAGSEWVVEARTSGRFQLLVPPQARPWTARWARLVWWMRAFRPAAPRGLRA